MTAHVLNLEDYQEVGRDFLVARDAAILGDRPGLGKTAQAIAAAIEVGARRILVICPSILLVNWQREFVMWWPRYGSHLPMPAIFLAEGSAGKAKSWPPALPMVAVVNHDKLSLERNDWATFAIGSKWDVVILDEAHNFKNLSAKRTKTVYGRLLKNNPKGETRWWLLSGTIAPNHAGELYPHLRALFHDVITKPDGTLMSRTQFEDAYCVVVDTPFGRSIKGSRNLDVLKRRLAPHYLARPEPKSMPPLRFAELPVRLNPRNSQAQQLLKRASQELREAIREAKTPDEVLAVLKSNEIMLSSQRRIMGVLKAEMVADLVISEIGDNHDKRIVFFHHTEAIDKAAEHLKNIRNVVLDGRTPKQQRQALIDQFQSDPECRVFLGQLAVCQEGLTLTAANHVILAEPSWVPKDNYQAAKRAARKGQTRPVLARFIIAQDTVDDIIMRVVARKTKDLADLFG